MAQKLLRRGVLETPGRGLATGTPVKAAMGTLRWEGSCGVYLLSGSPKNNTLPPRGARSQPAAQPSLAESGTQSHLAAWEHRASCTPRQGACPQLHRAHP